MKFVLVYITAANAEEAAKIGRLLLEKKLVACVNIFDRVRSFYRWEGKIEQGDEVAMIAKTDSTLVPKLTKTVRKVHSYECPCIVSIPIENGNPEYLKWLQESLK